MSLAVQTLTVLRHLPGTLIAMLNGIGYKDKLLTYEDMWHKEAVRMLFHGNKAIESETVEMYNYQLQLSINAARRLQHWTEMEQLS